METSIIIVIILSTFLMFGFKVIKLYARWMKLSDKEHITTQLFFTLQVVLIFNLVSTKHQDQQNNQLFEKLEQIEIMLDRSNQGITTSDTTSFAHCQQ